MIQYAECYSITLRLCLKHLRYNTQGQKEGSGYIKKNQTHTKPEIYNKNAIEITQKNCMTLIFKQIHTDFSDKARSDKWVVLGSHCPSSELTGKKSYF